MKTSKRIYEDILRTLVLIITLAFATSNWTPDSTEFRTQNSELSFNTND